MRFDAAASLEQRWLWLGISLLIAAIAVWARWGAQRGPQYPWLMRLQHSTAAPWLAQGLRLAYAVGIPAGALLWQGDLTERGLGLQPFPWNQITPTLTAQSNWVDWLRDLGWAMIIAAGAAALFTCADRLANTQRLRRSRDAGVAVREALYHQVHWAFYREPFILLGGLALGPWMGLLPVLIEAALNPARWKDLLDGAAPGRALLFRGAIAIVSVLLYIQTQNLWVMLPVDALLVWSIGQPAPQS